PGRIQRQVHVGADGVARRQLRHPAEPYSRQLPQLFLSAHALAIRRPAPGPRRPPMTAQVQLHEMPIASSASLRDEVLAGFSRASKAISPKHFYDRRGSELFEQICQQPEYYPTRTEEQILARIAPEIAEIAGPQANLVELGS